MPSRMLLLFLMLALAGCASGDRAGGPADVLPGESSSSAKAKRVVNTVGTPVHAVIKGVSCVAVGAVALPVASAAQIGDDQQLRQQMYRSVGQTCGGSYVLGR